jgi:hypothetical protein
VKLPVVSMQLTASKHASCVPLGDGRRAPLRQRRGRRECSSEQANHPVILGIPGRGIWAVGAGPVFLVLQCGPTRKSPTISAHRLDDGGAGIAPPFTITHSKEAKNASA